MLQRTPPSAPRYSSDTDLSRIDQADFVSTRKRKQRPETEEWELLRSDLSSMFAKLSAEQDNKFKQINETVKELSDQNLKIIAMNKNMEETLDRNIKLYEDLKMNVQQLSKQHQESLIRIESLEEQVEYMQRQQLSSQLEINNLPKSDKEDLYEIVRKIHSSLKLNISKDDIVKAYRTNNNKKKTVVVQYRLDRVKIEILKAIKNYNNMNQNKPYNANNVESTWQDETLYFSESLTTRARGIFFAARNFKKAYNYKYCWSANGKIFLKKMEGSPAILIKSQEQLKSMYEEAKY